MIGFHFNQYFVFGISSILANRDFIVHCWSGFSSITLTWLELTSADFWLGFSSTVLDWIFFRSKTLRISFFDFVFRYLEVSLLHLHSLLFWKPCWSICLIAENATVCTAYAMTLSLPKAERVEDLKSSKVLRLKNASWWFANFLEVLRNRLRTFVTFHYAIFQLHHQLISCSFYGWYVIVSLIKCSFPKA